MNENTKWIAAVVVVHWLVVGGVVIPLANHPTAPEPVAAVPAKPRAPEEPAVKHPLPASESKEPLPPLNESDRR
jgi:hypothetical protein